MAEMGPANVIMTLGKKGSLYYNGEKLINQPAFKVKAVDTTGAGDAFCAGALIGIYRELDEMGILTLASKAATASLSAPDSIGGMVSEAEIDELLKEMNIDF